MSTARNRNRRTTTRTQMPATLAIRLELENIADDLHDQALAAAEEFHTLEGMAADARERWRLLELQRAAAEQALRELPEDEEMTVIVGRRTAA